MSKTFSGTYNSGVTLGGAVDNPATFAPKALVYSGNNYAALSGPGGTAWTVTNYGTIVGNGAASDGVYLASGGNFTNFKLVGGTQNGIKIQDTSGNADLIFNSGAIVSTSNTSGGGIFLPHGGSVLNQGAITALRFGIYAGGADYQTYAGAVTALTNEGTIASTGAGNHTAVLFAGGGTVDNFGLITSASGDAVFVSGTQSFVENTGTISGNLGVDLAFQGSQLANLGTIIGNYGTAVALDAADELVSIGTTAVFQGYVAGFQAGDTLDFLGVVASGYTWLNGVLALTIGSGEVLASLSLQTSETSPSFILAADGHGGTDVTLGAGGGGTTLSGTYTTTVQIAPNTPTTLAATASVSVAQGDAVTNQPGYPATVANYGMIAAASGRGVYLGAGGVVTNSGAVSGYTAGVAASGGSATVGNAGIIAATGYAGVGVLLGAGTGAVAASRPDSAGYYQTLVNYGTISGYTGVMATGYGSHTVTNAGVILGYGGTAVMLAGGYDRLVVDENGAFQGVADGGGGSSVLELAGPANPGGTIGAQYIGTLAGIGSSFVNFGTLVVDAGTNWEIAGYGSYYQFVNDGTIIIADNITPTGDVMVFGAVGEDMGDHGVIVLAAGGTGVFTGSVDKGQKLAFAAHAYGVLQLADPAGFQASIRGFRAGDVIDLEGQPVDSDSFKKGNLTLREGGSVIATISFIGHYSAADFQLTPDGAGGTDITVAAGAASATGPPSWWAIPG